jgi:hypothetical protein
MLVCDLCLLYLAVLVVSGLSEVLGALRQILLSYLVHMHSRSRSLRQGQVHVGPITWEVLPQQSYKPPQLPMYDGHSDPKQFLMSYEQQYPHMEATQLSIRNVAQTWYSSARDNHVMVEAQGHAGYQFSRLSDEVGHSSGLVPVHTRP